jgi:NADH-quinone oxidoreductase subunit N
MFAMFSYNNTSKEGIVLYAAAYCVATIGLFAILMKMEDYTFEGFNGFAKKEPLLAALATIFLLSLAGIPVTAGFFGKYFMVASVLTATKGKFIWLVFIAMLSAAVSVYYYFRVIQAMYFKTAGGETSNALEATSAFRAGLVVLAAITLILGVMPQMLLQYLYF